MGRPGTNLAVTADQIKQAFGPAEIDRLALKTQLSIEEVTSHLTRRCRKSSTS